MLRDAATAYDSVGKATDSSRGLEAAALFKIARLFEACRTSLDTAEGRARLDEALHKNQLLWTIFQSELGRSDHPLPVEVRVNLLKLSAFVDRRTFELLAHPTPDQLQPLIDLNRNVASGLVQAG